MITDKLINRNIEAILFKRIEKDETRTNWSSTFDKCSNQFSEQTAEILIQLEDKVQFLVSSHCLEDENGNDYFKLKVLELITNLNSLKKWNGIRSSKILNIQLYNQTIKSNYYFEKLDYNDQEYLSDTMVIELSNNMKLVVLAHTSIEEHEPRLDFGIYNREEYSSFKSQVIVNWKQKSNYL